MARTRGKVNKLPLPKTNKSRGARKLTNNQILEIVAIYRETHATQKKISKHYNVSQVTISNILRGRTYAWLTGIGREQLANAA